MVSPSPSDKSYVFVGVEILSFDVTGVFRKTLTVRALKSSLLSEPHSSVERVRGCLMLLVLLSFATGMCANEPDSSWGLGPFVRPAGAAPIISPIKDAIFDGPLSPAPVRWESLHTFNPGAIVRDGKIYMLYRAEDDSGKMKIGGHTSRIGLAVSEDGIHFQRDPKPVLFPADDDQKSREWPGGCEDPRVVEAEDGTYVVAYTQWNHRRFDAAIATSKDLRTWTKHGPAFAKAYGGKYKNLQYKSMGIVTKLQDGRLKATKINGKYLMYWGEGKIYLATSKNLIDWDPVEDKNGKLITVLARRPHLFDSRFPEVGPPPILTDRGILLIYNGKNAVRNGDKNLAPQTYSVGQALFSPENPTQLLKQVDQPVFKPELPWERSGQYMAGTTFVQGLVYYNGKWFLYYGCADSLVGVAISDHPAL
jgi:beta-1,2-mannosidase